LQDFSSALKYKINNLYNRLKNLNVNWKILDKLDITDLKNLEFTENEISILLPYIWELKNKREIDKMFDNEIDVVCGRKFSTEVKD